MPDLEFSWSAEPSIDPQAQEAILSSYASKGILTINEARAALGRDPYPNAAANKPMVLTGGGYVGLGQAAPVAKFNPNHDEHGLFTTADGAVQPVADTRQHGRPIDLRYEEQHGGHTIAEHVGKNRKYLLARLSDEAASIRTLGDTAQGLTAKGSFTSLEAANKLVNSTLAQNQGTLNLVAAGALEGAQFDANFSSPTGYEAFAETERSQPFIRDTYGVHVVIVHDGSSPNGYRVLTAFPRNR